MLTKYTLLAALASLSSCAFAAPLIGIDNAHPAPLEARYTPSGLWNGFYVKIQDGRRFRRPASDGNDWLTRAVDSRFVSVNEKGEFAERSFEVDSDENGLFKCEFVGNLKDPSQAAPTFTFGRNKLYYETVRGVSVSCIKH